MSIKKVSERRLHDASKKTITDADLLFAVTKRPGEQFGIGFRMAEGVSPLEYLEGISAIIELVVSASGYSVETALETIRIGMTRPMKVDGVVDIDADGNETTLTRN